LGTSKEGRKRAVEPITVLIGDDLPVVRDGLAGYLGSQSDIEVVAKLDDCQEILLRVGELQPDVALLDLEITDAYGPEVFPTILEESETTRILVFSEADGDHRALAALRAGATGHLRKDAPQEEIVRAIRTVHRGESFVTRAMAAELADRARGSSSALTPREMEVLEELAGGRSNRAIARRLYVTERTVKAHVSSILRKLGAENRTEAVAIAVRRGLVNL